MDKFSNYPKQTIQDFFSLNDNKTNAINERQRIPKGQSKMDNPEKLET